MANTLMHEALERTALRLGDRDALDGAVVQADKSGDQAQYGANVTIQEILDGQIQVPSSARRLIHELRAYPGAVMGM